MYILATNTRSTAKRTVWRRVSVFKESFLEASIELQNYVQRPEVGIAILTTGKAAMIRKKPVTR